MKPVADHAQRVRGIDCSSSFCVSAPAGSGKTELLIQRYLGLLSRVERPEQVLAITFTRKAAAEMRERVLEALHDAHRGAPCNSPHQQQTRSLAERALEADARGQWQLLRNVARLNIKTIDSFCLGLTRQMPILSGLGGAANPRDDAGEMYEAAVQALFGMLDEGGEVAVDLQALLTHFDNDWGRLQQLLVNLLMRRDQWRKYIGVHESPDESEAYLSEVVRTLVREELTATAQLLAPYESELLELLRFSAANLGVEQPDTFPACEPDALEQWRLLRTMLLTKNNAWRKQVTVKEGFPPDNKGEAPERKAQMKKVLAELATIPGLEERLVDIGILPTVERGSQSWQLVLHLSRLLPVLALKLLLVFRREGAVDYSQVSQLALQALGADEAPTELALRLDYRIEHILMDEFQDTSINQFDLLGKLTRGWGDYNAAHPETPRTLMIVGDAMQSIYGFRDANVGLFLRARRDGFNGVHLEHLELQCNFRSDAGVVDWVNETFRKAFPAADNIDAAQVKYSSALAVRAAGEADPVAMDGFYGDGAAAAEVEFVCAQIAACVARGERNIAVLGRQRNHLRPISRRLKELQIPCHAQDLDILGHAPAVADLLTLCRALYSDVDRVAWFALLRAPWCGLALADLLAIARFSQSRHEPLRLLLADRNLPGQLSEQGRARLAHVCSAMQAAWESRDRLGLRVWVERIWLDLGGPQALPDVLALEDAEHFFALLQKAESEGRGLDVEWLEQQVQGQYMGGGDPESPVHILTLHKAKGLEFDRVFIPRLNGQPAGNHNALLLWDEHNSGGERVFLLAANDRSAATDPTLYNYLKTQRKNKARLEATRLLYVGATRAIRHLHLSACISWDEGKGQPRGAPINSLLNTIWPSFEAAMTLHEAPAAALSGSAQQRPLVRLQQAHLPLPARSSAAAREDNMPERADNHLERSVGTVVHAALEELSLLPELPDAASPAQEARWRIALQALGLSGERLAAALASVLASVNTTLAEHGEGRWVLAARHPEARSEWALSVAEGDAVRDIVIDRTFVDAATDVRWIVDYKTSQPVAGESVASFLARESEHYREQLQIYRDALRARGEQTLRCALYFTALGLLHPLDDLQVSAGDP